MRSSEARLHDDFEPKYEDAESLELQHKHIVTHSTTTLVERDNGDESFQLFRVYVELGTRWLSAEANEGSGRDPNRDSDDQVKATIEAVMMAEYLMKTNLDPDCLNEFALKNASYHIWPYWREFLTSQSSRMNLPRLVLPMMQFATNRHTNATSPPPPSGESQNG